MKFKSTIVLLPSISSLMMVSACGGDKPIVSSSAKSQELASKNQAIEKDAGVHIAVSRRDAPYFDLIEEAYSLYPDEYARLTLRLEKDLEVKELYCDENMVVVTTRDETFYDGEDDPYTSSYMQLCRFAPKVTANRTRTGIRFPQLFFELGPKMVFSYLEKTTNVSDNSNICNYPLFDGDRGTCGVSIQGSWSATYEWKPFCLENMKGQVGC